MPSHWVKARALRYCICLPVRRCFLYILIKKLMNFADDKIQWYPLLKRRNGRVSKKKDAWVYLFDRIRSLTKAVGLICYLPRVRSGSQPGVPVHLSISPFASTYAK